MSLLLSKLDKTQTKEYAAFKDTCQDHNLVRLIQNCMNGLHLKAFKSLQPRLPQGINHFFCL